MIEYIFTFIACLVAGVLTGITGLGGGLVIVPAILTLNYFGYSDLMMHQIVGVSSAAVFFNSILSLYYRRKETFLPLKDNIKNCSFLIVGGFFGAYAAKYISEFDLNLLYLFVCSGSAVLLFKTFNFNLSGMLFLRQLLFFVSGAMSACVGIGGAAFFTIILRAFYKQKTKYLLATITLLVAVNALFAFVGKVFGEAVVWNMVPIIVMAGAIGSKIGVLVSKKMPSPAIRYTMAATVIIGIASVLAEVIQQG